MIKLINIPQILQAFDVALNQNQMMQQHQKNIPSDHIGNENRVCITSIETAANKVDETFQ
jgi:hypothetical protein